jgi:hypothetical protein
MSESRRSRRGRKKEIKKATRSAIIILKQTLDQTIDII